MFPERSIRVSAEGKNVNVSHIFDLRSLVIAKCDNGSKKKLLEDDKITACVKQISLLGVIHKVLNRKTLSGETFCFLEKRMLSIFKFHTSSNLFFPYKLQIGPQPTFLECIVIFLKSDRSTLSRCPWLQ